MKRYVFASHSKMASGMKATLEFLTKSEEVYTLCAYDNECQDEDLEEKIQVLLHRFDPNDLVIIMTDIMSGSVNQKFFSYISERVYLIAGINIPLAMSLALTPEENLSEAAVLKLVEEARNQIVFVNDWQSGLSEGDE